MTIQCGSGDGPITNSNFWAGPPGQESFYNISKDLKERILGATSKVPRWVFINIDWQNSFVNASIDDDFSYQTWKILVLGNEIYIYKSLLWTITAHLTSAEIIIGNSNKHYQRTNVKLVVSKVQIQPSLQVGYCRCPVGFSFGLIDLEYFSFPHVVRVLWWIQGEYWAVCRVFGTFQSKCEFSFFPPCF